MKSKFFLLIAIALLFFPQIAEAVTYSKYSNSGKDYLILDGLTPNVFYYFYSDLGTTNWQRRKANACGFIRVPINFTAFVISEASALTDFVSVSSVSVALPPLCRKFGSGYVRYES